MNATPASVIYPLSLHDALPILEVVGRGLGGGICGGAPREGSGDQLAGEPGHPRRVSPAARERTLVGGEDRKSTRLNSSHPSISYAVFCLKKKIIDSHNTVPMLA